MLEIILVVGLCRALGNKLRAKGRKPFWMQFMLVAFWIGGEIGGAFVAGIIHVVRNGVNAPMGLEVYLFAIFGAVVGAGVTFLIAHMLPSLEPATVPQGPVSDPFDRHLDANNPYAS